MKLATAMHTNSFQIPFNFDFNLLKSSPITCPKNVPARFVLRSSHPLLSGGCACARKYYSSIPVFSETVLRGSAERRSTRHNYSTITCARRTEREQDASTSQPLFMVQILGYFVAFARISAPVFVIVRDIAKEASKQTRLQLPDGIDETESLCDDNSSAISGEANTRTADYASSLRTVGLCLFSAVAFGVGLGFKDGVGKASEFFAGYLLEQSLSVDNLFVFVLIFKYFQVPFSYQNRVLSYGIAGAIVFRLSLILLGTATLQRFEAVNLLLATILLYSSFKLFAEEDEDTDLSDNFIVKTCQKFIPVTSNYDGNRFITTQDGVWKATPLLLTVAVIELSDIAFAVDSIPAVFGVTRDPFIVFSSNLFAILGLRSYYTLISESMADLEYLQVAAGLPYGNENGFTQLVHALSGNLIFLLVPAIAVVLGFIGCKMILDFFGFPHIDRGFPRTGGYVSAVTKALIKLPPLQLYRYRYECKTISWHLNVPDQAASDYYRLNLSTRSHSLMAASAVEEVLPPHLNSTSEPPPLFDGTTRLYINDQCPFAQRTWITRNYKGLQDEIKLVPIDLQDRPAWYKEKVYPENKVPALEHNGKVIGESLDLVKYIDTNFKGPALSPDVPALEHNGKVIGESQDLIKYIDANFKGPALLPDDPAKKKFAEELIAYCDTFTKNVWSSFKGDPIKQAGAEFDYLEKALHKFDDGPFFLGQFSEVDIAYIPFVERFQIFFQEEWKYDITSGRPKLAKWIEVLNSHLLTNGIILTKAGVNAMNHILILFKTFFWHCLLIGLKMNGDATLVLLK
ncbi:Thylakoid membrane protein TERC, chloroplastic [Sesamum angolense]|uniref:Thylakoid membrane protein TERC, chloroplastic n=1 Tax=Sesamum angolense TaxID=2727404 RepID=A0AAE1WNB5_9LAMI|nr:Thylakoid membrane protein TERC, chloroplastic [Sesamum angolense]